MSEIYDEAHSNSQDSPSISAGGSAAHASVPHAVSKSQSDNPGPTHTTKAGETYVHYICRRDDEQNAVVGIVEIVGTQEEISFRSLEELLIILNMTEVGAVIKWKR